MIKIIASDMDGTLLNSNHEITKENIMAIREANKKGVKFIIVTGRQYGDVEYIAKEYGLECEYILMNGAEYRDASGNVIEAIDIDKNKVLEIIDIIQSNNMRAELYTDQGIYSINSKEEALKGVAYRIQSFEKIQNFEEALEKARMHPIFTKLKYVENIDNFLQSNIKIRKIIAFYNDVDIIKKVKGILDDVSGLAVSSSFYDNIEVTDIKAQKGIILSKVAQKMNIKKEEVIVLGDSFNDFSMFSEFPISFAMGNAIPEIKEIAKYITETNDNSGVAAAIYKALEM